jgi:hypothetical protein
MRQQGRWFGILFILIASSSVNAFDWSSCQWRFEPYLGVDGQWRRADFKGGFGDNLFAHTYPQANAYGGFKFLENVGLEFGYEMARSRSRITILTTGDIAAGTPIVPATSPVTFRSQGKFQGPHVDLVGFYSICPEQSPIQLVGSIGVAFLKGTFERRTIKMQNITVNTNRTLSEHKAVLRLAGGLQYMLTDHLGIRGMLGWVNTSRMVIFANDGLPGRYIPEVKPKNSAFWSIGALLAY